VSTHDHVEKEKRAEFRLDPEMFKWIDERLANDERMLMVRLDLFFTASHGTHTTCSLSTKAFSTTAMHHPFEVPVGYEHQTFSTASGYADRYLNVIKYTDDQLKVGESEPACSG
jgi:phosphoglycerol transferase MdoB-like AlkP superfamily enzyme